MAASRRSGEDAPNAAVSNAAAEEIRWRFETEKATIGQLAQEYGCCYKTVWRIVNRLTYREGPGSFS